jgi:hypothetical protein
MYIPVFQSGVALLRSQFCVCVPDWMYMTAQCIVMVWNVQIITGKSSDRDPTAHAHAVPGLSHLMSVNKA